MTRMGRLIYSSITSLDGYIADSDGEFDWSAPDAEVHAFVNDRERPIGTYLYGRRLYEVMTYWETATAENDPDMAPVELDYADIWRAAEKVVYSTTLEAVTTSRTRLERSFDAARRPCSRRCVRQRCRARWSDTLGQRRARGDRRRVPPVHQPDHRRRWDAAVPPRRARGPRAAREPPLRQRRDLRALRGALTAGDGATGVRSRRQGGSLRWNGRVRDPEGAHRRTGSGTMTTLPAMVRLSASSSARTVSESGNRAATCARSARDRMRDMTSAKAERCAA